MKYLKFIVPTLVFSILFIGIIIVFNSRQKPLVSVIPIRDVLTPKTTLKSVVSIDQVFSSQSAKLANDPDLITILATGDVVPGRSVNYQTLKYGDFNWPWKNTASVLKSADLTYVNFEVPLYDNCPVTNEGMNFCGDPKVATAVKNAGVDVANIANNHAGDHGTAGVKVTTDFLENAGISVTGNGQIVYQKVKGTTFAFLGYNDVTSVYNPSPADEATIKKDVLDAKSKADVVIVGFHWGIEYTAQPSERQVKLAHAAIDDGADLILGNHPHWIQPLEFYKGKAIMYAHGNFIFDQMWSEKTEEGVVAKYTFQGRNLVAIEFLPIKIKDYGQPYFLTGNAASQVLADLKRNSEILASLL